mgnify:CR=1 FL=1
MTGVQTCALPISIPDLLNKKYYIPEYQRGYRWEETQVLDLLQDLYAFFIGDTKGQFYCLQPIVVKEKQMNNELWYEVIDGQQRLTTIRIIMQIYDQLNSNMFTTISHKYTIMYATRPDMVDIFGMRRLFLMKHIKTLTTRDLKESMKKGGCGECQTSCQSACKTSCTVGNQS